MKIKNILGLIALFSTGISFGQGLVNGDNVVNGVNNQWFLSPSGNALSAALNVPIDGTTQMNLNSLGNDLNVPPYTAAMQFGVLTGMTFNFQDVAGDGVLRIGNKANIRGYGSNGNMDILSNSIYMQTGPGLAVTIQQSVVPFDGIIFLGPSGAYVRNNSDANVHVPNLTVDSLSANGLPYIDSSNLLKASSPAQNQVMMGDVSGAPVLTTLTAGTGISLDNSVPNFLTINNTGPVDLTAYEQAIGVPTAGTITGGPYMVFDGSGNPFLTTGRYLRFNDTTNTYNTQLFQNGLDFSIYSVSSGARTVINTQLTTTLWSPSTILVTDASSQAQSLPLSSGQFLSANSSGVPISANFVEGSNMSITNDGLGNTTFTSFGVTETNTPVTCQFNAGSAAGVTDFTMTFNFKRIGNIIYVEVPEKQFTPATPAIYVTSNSASPACVPVELIPRNTSYGFITTNSGGTVPTGAAGSFQIDKSGDIAIFYQNSGFDGNFPAGTPGGTGLGQGTSTADYIQQMIYAAAPSVPYVVSGTGTNGSVLPSPQYWSPGYTPSLTFNLNPSAGYVIDTASDTCNSGSSGGSIVGSNYVLTTVNQNCVVTANFITEPGGTYTVDSFGAGAGVIPSSANWVTGTTTELDFTVDRFSGNQLSAISDNCNGGAAGGTLVGNVYKITAVTSNCTITVTGNNYLKISYVDFTAVGSLSVIPPSSYAFPNLIPFGFAAPSASSLTSPQLSAVVTAIANESVGTKNFLSLGGATYDYASFVAVGFSTVISNALSIVSQINGAAANPITGIDLDLEGSGWNPTDIQTLITGFHGAGLLVSCTPQLYYTGSNTVNPANPTNLILTSGGGTGNTFGTATSTGQCDYVFAQTYNSGGWTIGNAGEGTPEFFLRAAQALSNTIRATCSGATPLCIQAGTQIAIGNVANAGAGGGGPGAPTIFNPTAVQIYPALPNCNPAIQTCYTIPSYNQSTILSSYAGYITSALTGYPAISGMMMFSHNNDYAAPQYNSTDSATPPGNFTATIYGVNL